MRFVLEVHLDKLGGDGPVDRAQELQRILRYWGGNMHHYDLSDGDGSAVYDSGYREVGQWSISRPAQAAPPD